MMEKKNVFIRSIDKNLWEQFKAEAVNRCGRLWGVLAPELETAIRLYLDAEDRRHTHASFNPSPPSKKVLAQKKKLEEAVLKVAESGGSIPFRMLEDMVRRTCGVTDRRTVRNRVDMLVASGFLKRDFSISLKGNVFEVVGNEADNIR